MKVKWGKAHPASSKSHQLSPIFHPHIYEPSLPACCLSVCVQTHCNVYSLNMYIVHTVYLKNRHTHTHAGVGHKWIQALQCDAWKHIYTRTVEGARGSCRDVRDMKAYQVKQTRGRPHPRYKRRSWISAQCQPYGGSGGAPVYSSSSQLTSSQFQPWDFAG